MVVQSHKKKKADEREYFKPLLNRLAVGIKSWHHPKTSLLSAAFSWVSSTSG